MFQKIKLQLNLENYFLLIIFLLPTYFFRFSIFGLPTNLWEILAILAIILALWKIGRNNVEFSGYEKKVTLLFLMIISGLILGIIKNGNYKIGLGVIKGWFLIPFFFAICAEKIVKNKKSAYSSLFLSAFFVSSAALIYKLLGIVTYDGRLAAFFNSPNYLAMYVAPGIIIGTITLVQNQKLKISAKGGSSYGGKNQNDNLKLKIIFINLLIAAVLFFTYSYTAWISVILALAIIFLLNNKFCKKYLIIICSIFFVLIFLLKDTAKFNDLASFDSRSSSASRMMIWQSVGKILSDNYVIGIGPGNFQDKYLAYQKYFPPYLEWAVPHPHNLFVAFWLYSGLLGLVSFIAILYFFFKKGLGDLRNHKAVRALAIGIVIYFLLHGLVDTTYFKNDLAVVFWLVVLGI